jgi:hypothetical protein
MSVPWYRHRWPWLLMLGPVAVLIAGAIPMWIAFAGADGMVAEDYYKQGLAINKRLAREDEARRLGITARVQLEPRRIRVRVTGDAPPVLFVQPAHATRAGYHVRLGLTPVAPGAYEAELDALPRGHWRAAVEGPRGAWRTAQDLS